ncbi:hypothetical protein UNDYM_4119 [Undibacterium sp. YM2]|uniref:hypothetical protein n=1 Tax=Undibacterium sp. YM2 TaxID=2058625 RepID=UPI001331FAC2|nr:hypothetical protein [Undibacterium sp. YM2]BBB68372.1 hypothetical protein UNDYM_4119 [Undibacterium sp. YM2]
MQIPKSKDTLIAIWSLTIMMWLPPAWQYFFQTDFFFKNMRGLQNFAVSAPVLLIILAYAILLTLPKTRTWDMVLSAGGSLFTMGLLMQYYEMFQHTGGVIVMVIGGALLNTYRQTIDQKAYELAADKAMDINNANEPGPGKAQKSRA